MKRFVQGAVVGVAAVLFAAGMGLAHDLFLKPARYHVPPNSEVLVRVLNGTFSKSENSISRDRIVDISIVSNGSRFRMDTSRWGAVGDTSTFQLRTLGPGTYVLGVSTQPRTFELTADQFNEYLATDGVPDVLAARRKSGEAKKGARERYGKHVKSLVQVGDQRSTDFSAVLGYPAELVPLNNPYDMRAGDTLRVRAIVDGANMPNQYVLYGGRTPAGARVPQRSVRTDADGVAHIVLKNPGVWFVKFIRMTRQPPGNEADYESKWATLTFELR